MSNETQKNAQEADTKAKVGALAAGSGAVAAAFAAAACCIGPLIVAVLGIGGAGAMVALAPYRPYFMVATVLMLGAGFFMVYRKRPAPAAVEGQTVAGQTGDACGCDDEAPKKKRNLAKVMLWVATAMVILFSASPYIIEATATASESPPVATELTPSPMQASLVQVEIPVAGMDCASCGVAIQRAMDNVGVAYQDFELDLERQTVSFRYEGDSAVAERFAGSIREIGYEVGEPTLLAEAQS
ncbi:MAG TPA: hypothetical protein DEF51_49335 [Myxococcales bacterium]|nr:hypothetical protein [Myxococcales bacterium]